MAEQLDDPDVELTIENFAPIMATYNQLRHAGMKFDAMLEALMATLNRQAFNTPDDSDQDSDRQR